MVESIIKKEIRTFWYNKGKKKGRVEGAKQELDGILKQFKEAEYLEGSPRDYKLRIKWYIEKRLLDLQKKEGDKQ